MGSSLEEVIFKLNPDERIALVKGMAARDGGAGKIIPGKGNSMF